MEKIVAWIFDIAIQPERAAKIETIKILVRNYIKYPISVCKTSYFGLVFVIIQTSDSVWASKQSIKNNSSTIF
jgi:hypothetical protein